MSLISLACRDALQHWLQHQKALNGASENTITAYNGDVAGFMAFMTVHFGAPQGLGALSRISPADMRAWMASGPSPLSACTAGEGGTSTLRQAAAML